MKTILIISAILLMGCSSILPFKKEKYYVSFKNSEIKKDIKFETFIMHPCKDYTCVEYNINKKYLLVRAYYKNNIIIEKIKRLKK